MSQQGDRKLFVSLNKMLILYKYVPILYMEGFPKITVLVAAGSHRNDVEITRQINDKERRRAALANREIAETVHSAIAVWDSEELWDDSGHDFLKWYNIIGESGLIMLVYLVRDAAGLWHYSGRTVNN